MGIYCKQNQYNWLKLSKEDKYNYVFIFNPKIKQGKHENAYKLNMYAQIHDTHMYTHILTKYRLRKSLMG